MLELDDEGRRAIDAMVGLYLDAPDLRTTMGRKKGDPDRQYV